MTTLDKYYNSIVVGLFFAILILWSVVCVLLYQIHHRPLPQFFAVSNGKQIQLNVYDEPNYLPSTILSWASKAAVAAYTFDFVNYNQQARSVAPYFTSSGWIDYQNSVSRLIEQIRQRQLFVNAVVSGTPIISSQGDFYGKGYSWRVQLPFLVTFQTAEETSREDYVVLMSVAKVPTNVDPRGIGIDQFVMR